MMIMISMMMIAMILMAMILGDDDDNVTLGIPETQKSPSMAWKNFMPFYNSTQPLTYHLTFCLHSFSFFFLSLKLK